MNTILITGASGNVGGEVIKSLKNRGIVIRAAVCTTDDTKTNADQSVVFDFAQPETYDAALEGVDGVFLMRPPAISDVKKYIFPFIDAIKRKKIKHTVLLSLMGAQWNIFAPHHKIEKYMMHLEIPYTFIRPSFFMQNLSTFYRDDIKDRHEIFVPAGYGKTSFIDIRDIAEVCAKTFLDSNYYRKAYTLTGNTALTYFEVADIMSEILDKTIVYKNPTSSEYIERKRKEGTKEEFIQVMSKIYLVSRLRLAGGITGEIEKILQRKPITFRTFVEDYKSAWS